MVFLAESNVGHKLCQPNDVVVNTMWAWMAALGAVMFYEKVGRFGDRLTPVVGVVLLALAVLIFVHPAGLPSAFGT